MQYAIPQFVEIEDKVIGPLTVKQFAYILGGGLVILALSNVLSAGPLIFVGIIIAAIVIPLAFLKINGKPLPEIGMSLVQFNLKPKKRLWAKDLNDKSIQIQDTAKRESPQEEGPRVKSLDRGNLAELALQLDTFGTAAEQDTPEPESIAF